MNAETQTPWQIAEAMHNAENREWVDVTREFYWESLEVLPPIYVGAWWGVGEPWKHDASNRPVFLFFRETPKHQCRYATVAEIKAEQQRIYAAKVEVRR